MNRKEGRERATVRKREIDLYIYIYIDRERYYGRRYQIETDGW